MLHAKSRAHVIPHGARELAARIRGEDERRDAEERDGAVQLRDDAGRVGLGGDARAPLVARSRLNGMHEVARAVSCDWRGQPAKAEPPLAQRRRRTIRVAAPVMSQKRHMLPLFSGLTPFLALSGS